MFFCCSDYYYYEVLIDSNFINNNTIDFSKIKNNSSIQQHLYDDNEEQVYFRKFIKKNNRFSYIFKIKKGAFLLDNIHEIGFVENLEKIFLQSGLTANVISFFLFFFI